MIYELINPSDPYTMEASGDAVAAAACLLLGSGAYGLRREDGTSCPTPVLLFFKPNEVEAALTEWWSRTYGGSYREFYRTNAHALADALASVTIGEPRTVAALRATLRALGHDGLLRGTAREAWHDAVRSSLNDVGRSAWDLARRVAEGATAGRPPKVK